jgi:hypothetical protein
VTPIEGPWGPDLEEFGEEQMREAERKWFEPVSQWHAIRKSAGALGDMLDSLPDSDAGRMVRSAAVGLLDLLEGLARELQAELTERLAR